MTSLAGLMINAAYEFHAGIEAKRAAFEHTFSERVAVETGRAIHV
ncbi:hypothetical protein [Promicromonospora iranensis]|nr:hypothetical protein [Promicromonospora iranensis]